MKRLLACLLAAMLLLGTAALADAAELDPVNLIWYVGGNYPQEDQDAVFAEANRMLKEKLNVQIDFRVTTYGDYESKMNVVISSGEKYDMCYTANWLNNYGTNVARGAFLPLDDLLTQYAPRTWAQVPTAFWDATRVNGKIYAVVCEQVSARTPAYEIRTEDMEAIGFTLDDIEPLNMLSVEPLLKYATETFDGSYFSTDVNNIAEYVMVDWPNGWATPGAIDLTKEGDTTIINQWDTELINKFIDDMQYFAEMGYTNAEERITMPADQASSDKLVREGQSCLGLGGSWKPGLDVTLTMNSGGAVRYSSAASGPAVLTTSGIIATMQAISVTSERPERAMMVFEELNSREEGDDYNEIYNTLCFGIEGKNWNLTEDGFRRQIDYQINTEWMYASNFQAVIAEGNPATLWDDTRAYNAGAEVSPICGFVFDSTPVITQVSNCQAICTEYYRLINIGAITDTEFDEMKQRLADAGADIIIAEMQKQVDAWIASK